MFCTGLGLYLLMIALALEKLPLIVSPIKNLSCADMNILLLIKSSETTVAVAFEVCPVTTSPTVNLPKDESSKINLSPESNCVLS